jgi:hypothetical protein
MYSSTCVAVIPRMIWGMHLQVGCGVGGPMRTIASTSGAHVTGITINDYQVERATYHNTKVCPWELWRIGTPRRRTKTQHVVL